MPERVTAPRNLLSVLKAKMVASLISAQIPLFEPGKMAVITAMPRPGVINLTRCLALELAPEIRVNCITPGFIETEEVMTRYNLYNPENLTVLINTIPMGRQGKPEDIFKAAEFIVEDADYITGQNFFVNGGNLM